MSQENVEIARRNYELFRETWKRVKAGEQLAASPIWELWDPDAVVVEIADFPDANTYRGHQGITRWWMGWFENFEDALIEPQDFVPFGDHVVVQTHQWFLSKMGIEVEQDITHVLTIRDGKLVYATGYRDRAKALEAVGLSEQDAHADS
jgi:ketosteroid isomerase-like protein